MKRLLIFSLLATSLISCGEQNKKFTFSYWNEGETLTALTSFVEDVTDSKSQNYVKPEERVAVFDMDGTFYAELFPTYLEYLMFLHRVYDDSTYTPSESVLAAAEVIKAGSLTHTYPSGTDLLHANAAAEAYSGMTVGEFDSYAKEFLKLTPNGFTGMTYSNAFYKPMLEVFDYLEENDFEVYVVSGSDRYLIRSLCIGKVNVPANHIIGMDVALRGSEEGDTNPLNYDFNVNEDLVRTSELLVKNLKTNKVLAIEKEIGITPILSFGNTGGDVAMHNFTLSNKNHVSKSFMLVADDGDRDHAPVEKAPGLKEKWKAAGYQVVSMKDDFKTIYGDGVEKVDFVQ